MKVCLVVDDSRVARLVARKILQGLGFKVMEAEDGQQALHHCRQGLPDGVLLDWIMPGMDGLAFLRAMRQLPGGNTVKVVFCTTNNEPTHIQEALAAGADEYIMKPFDRESIHSKFLQVSLL